MMQESTREKLRSKIQAMRHLRTGTLRRQVTEDKSRKNTQAAEVKKIEAMLQKLGMNAEMVKQFANRAMRSGQVRDEASLMKMAEEFVRTSTTRQPPPPPPSPPAGPLPPPLQK